MKPDKISPKPDKTAIFKRADALDALRGIAILAMILSGTIPFAGALPAWMYHAQFPPPNHQFNPDIPGLTWVDLVFPLFIFALGAAIPLAQSRRLAKGWTKIQIILSTLKRGFFLVTFAIVSQHFRPLTINPEPVLYKWRFALLGFLILFLMFVQFPKTVPKWLQRMATVAGWSAAFIFLYHIQYPHHAEYQNFSLNRSDIIILVLANVSVFTTLFWLFLRHKIWLRLGVLTVLFPLLLSFNEGSWNTAFLKLPAISLLFNFDYLKYLFISIPATLVGDWFWAWIEDRDRAKKQSWTNSRCALIAIISLSLIVTLLIGLQARWLVQTAAICLVLCGLGFMVVQKPKNETEYLIKMLYFWACYWLGLGLAFEPYQGGIKKDSATMSYFFITTAISMFLLIVLILLINLWGQKRSLQLFIDNGQNPMIAYVAFGNLLWPILELTGWQTQILEMTQTPLLGFFRGVIYTSIVAIFVSLCTRLKLFWKT
ncbi:MAG: DUF5009 domain-containing protein [Cyanobacteriota bacterium]|nr:DUF5009 domain-containing protein [Cyanobacteriota bacterium]